MGLEVALIEREDVNGGLRLLGRSSDPDLIEAVREHLVHRLQTDGPSPVATLRLIRPKASGQPESEGPEDDM